MRKLFWIVLAVVLTATAVGIVVALGIHFAGLAYVATIAVVYQVFEGTMVAAILGAVAALAVVVAGVVALSVAASLAVAVPLVLAAVALALVVAVVAGLSPILVPVLLVVGAYALLTRRKRRAAPVESAPSSAPFPGTAA